jgi:DNA (cytosine-5)-methyltransferase 1
MERPTCLDLFCGAGGLSVGLRGAGFEIVYAADNWAPAVETYHSNLGKHAERRAIDERIDLPRADIIVGGPPCQGFSSAGLRKAGDHRNTLVTVFAQIVAEHRPRAFLFENVEGFLTAENGQRVLDLLVPLVNTGYRIHLRKVNAANYGVPQHRKRIIAVGGLGWDPSFPEATHSAYGAPGARLAGTHLPGTPTLNEAIRDLPRPSSEGPGVPQGHWYTPLIGIDLERAKHLKPGQSMRDLPESLWHDSFKRRANRRVMDGTPTERRGGAPKGVSRLIGDEPCKAVTGGMAEFLHPTEDRNLTVRECARIQTFPDTFTFSGNVSEQMQLIGNAVPPLLALVLSRRLLADLRKYLGQQQTRGALLSFVPTLSNGVSPALDATIETVRSHFTVAG